MYNGNSHADAARITLNLFIGIQRTFEVISLIFNPRTHSPWISFKQLSVNRLKNHGDATACRWVWFLHWKPCRVIWKLVSGSSSIQTWTAHPTNNSSFPYHKPSPSLLTRKIISDVWRGGFLSRIAAFPFGNLHAHSIFSHLFILHFSSQKHKGLTFKIWFYGKCCVSNFFHTMNWT